MAAILEFSINHNCSRVTTPHPSEYLIGMPDMNNQKRKQLYQAKEGLPSWLPDYSPCLSIYM